MITFIYLVACALGMAGFSVGGLIVVIIVDSVISGK